MNAAVLELRRLIGEQREEFLDELPTQVVIIEALCQRIEAGRGTTLDCRQLQRIAHGIAGCAGMYGYPALGLAAQDLERAVEARDAGELAGTLAKLKRRLP